MNLLQSLSLPVLTKKWTFSIPNPLWSLLYKARVHAAVRKWNNDVPWIKEQVRLVEDGPATSVFAPGSYMSWSQLVWQEIIMWSSLGEADGFQWTCDRRGFTPTQREYLLNMCRYLRLKVSG